jgi:uncharacterized protein (TIGR01777 family)
METVLITGGSGLVGTMLTQMLVEKGYRVRHLSRHVRGDEPIATFLWNYEKDYLDPEALEDADHIIHLAGTNIAASHWTIDHKKEIVDSRVKSLELLHRKLDQAGKFPKTLVSASGVNFYGNTTTDRIFNESDPHGPGFLAKVCEEWERTALGFSKHMRVVVLRTGTVLSEQGGALEKIAKPVRYYLGAPLGSGRQWMPWIHIEDLCRMYIYALENPLAGIYNAAASEHITNRMLTQGIARSMHKFIFLPGIPELILKLVFGELAEIILYGSRVSNDKIQAEGFRFLYPELQPALDHIFHPKLALSLQ